METGGSRSPHAYFGDRSIAQAFVDRLQARLEERPGADAFRLRFDKVALRFSEQLQEGLRDAVPAGTTLLITITAPLRQASKTAAELIEKIRPLCARGATKTNLRLTLFENSILVRIAGGTAGKDNVVVLVHNPHSNAAALLDAAEELL